MRRIARRGLFVLVALGVTLPGDRSPASGPEVKTDVLLKRTVTDLPNRKGEVRVHLNSWEPPSETGVHDHKGPTVIYVLEGELSWVERGVPRALKAGQVFLEPAGVSHNVKNISSKPAKALAVHLNPTP